MRYMRRRWAAWSPDVGTHADVLPATCVDGCNLVKTKALDLAAV
jgi:hypothetical protein